MIKLSDKIREHGRRKYVNPARERHVERFTIRVGDVVGELKLIGRVPAVCSALRGTEFLKSNNLNLVEESGPPSGQSTTVVYTYEFVGTPPASDEPRRDPWIELRGSLKRVFAELGGGEAYLRKEREQFQADQENP